MRRLMLAALLAATMASGALAQTRGVTVTLRAGEQPGAPVAETVTLYGASHALVIGIDRYTGGWQRLRKAVADARTVADELGRRGFQVTLKTDLGGQELRTALREFFAIRGEDPSARLLLWFSGHGHTIDGEGFLVPADAPLPTTSRFKVSALHMRDFEGLVRLAEAKHVLSVFDSCFSGTIFEAKGAAAPPAITRKTTYPVRQFLTSGDADQQVADDGGFRTLFLRALTGEEKADANGDGYLTGSELGMFLSDRVTNLTRQAQTPRYGKLLDVRFDRGDFVFVLPKKAGPPPPRPPLPGTFSLEDLRQQQELRAGWERWQTAMDSAFRETEGFEGGADLKRAAWARFLSAYAEDNPFSSEDDSLRAKAQQRKAAVRVAVVTADQGTDTAQLKPAAEEVAEDALDSGDTETANSGTASADIETQVAIAPEAAATPTVEVTPSRVYGSDNDDSRIMVRAKMDSWIQVRDNTMDRLLLTRLLRAGDVYRVPDRPGLKLLTGNAGGLEILVDGQMVPSIGPVGRVRRDVALDIDRLRQGTAAVD